MTIHRSLLRPLRTRRLPRPANPPPADTVGPEDASLTPGTRKTLAAIGALWVSFAISAAPRPAAPSAS